MLSTEVVVINRDKVNQIDTTRSTLAIAKALTVCVHSKGDLHFLFSSKYAACVQAIVSIFYFLHYLSISKQSSFKDTLSTAYYSPLWIYQLTAGLSGMP